MAITKNSKPLGKYGRMRRTYLQKHHKVLYNQMFLDGSYGRTCAKSTNRQPK